MRLRGVVGALALACAAAAAAPLGASSVGLVPSSSPEITDALAAGLRTALADAGTNCDHQLELVVGAGATHWATATAPTVEMAFGSAVVALVTPPERATAHLVAQIGSRAHIPVVTTSRAPSIAGTGSYWVAQILEPRVELDADAVEAPEVAELNSISPDFESLFAARFASGADGWIATGFATGLVLGEAICASGLDRRKIALHLAASLNAVRSD